MTLEDIKKIMEQNRHEEAKNALLAMDAEGSATAESQYLLGTIFHRNNQLPEAVEAFKRSLLLNPNFTDSAISLSIVYNDIGHYQEGKAIFQQAQKSLEKKENNKPAPNTLLAKEIAEKHLELGNLYRKSHRFNEAANEFLKASHVDSQNIEARILLAKVQGQRGQLKLAHKELLALVEEYPSNISARTHLALLYYAMGNTVDAQMELHEALMQEPDNEQVKMYLSMTQNATESTL